MKNINITLQPLSLLVGAALIVVVGLTVSAVLPGGPAGRDAQLVTIDGQPAARDMVIIRQGVPFTVPSGKVLLVHSFGCSYGSASTSLSAHLYVDDISSGSRVLDSSQEAFVSLGEIPGGLPAWSGSVVRVENPGNGGPAMAIGHLEDA